MTQPHPIFQKELDAFREKFKGWILQDDQEMYRSFEVIEQHLLAALSRASLAVVEESIKKSIDLPRPYIEATAKEIIRGK